MASVRTRARSQSKTRQFQDSLKAPAWTHKYLIGFGGQTIKDLLKSIANQVKVHFNEQNHQAEITGLSRAVVRQAKELVSDELKKLMDTYNNEWIPIDEKLMPLIKEKIGAKGEKLRANNEGLKVTITHNGVNLTGPKNEFSNARALMSEIMLPLASESVIFEEKIRYYIVESIGNKGMLLRCKFNQVQAKIDNNRVSLAGPKDQVQKAKQYISDLIFEAIEDCNVYRRTIAINKKFHKQIYGDNGSNLKKLTELFPGVQISIPPEQDTSSKITIKGLPTEVDKCFELFNSMNKNTFNACITEKLNIPKEWHGFLIGKDGEIVKQLHQRSGTEIEFSRDEDDATVTIVGHAEAVKQAREALELACDYLIEAMGDPVNSGERKQKARFVAAGGNIGNGSMVNQIPAEPLASVLNNGSDFEEVLQELKQSLSEDQIKVNEELTEENFRLNDQLKQLKRQLEDKEAFIKIQQTLIKSNEEAKERKIKSLEALVEQLNSIKADLTSDVQRQGTDLANSSELLEEMQKMVNNRDEQLKKMDKHHQDLLSALRKENRDLKADNQKKEEDIKTKDEKLRSQAMLLMTTEPEQCAICFGREPDSVFMPCGHAKFCYECAKQSYASKKVCPFCRMLSHQIYKIYK